ncbi:MAG: MFS transporter [Lentilactobacillus diolivorans]|jgi:MFS family permease|nr:MFS transporter [Lentilactobacillus diolivorans]RRG01966.1 MAG: MFS transporter [Lactobacillus sp.]
MKNKTQNKLIIMIAGMGMLLSTLDTGIINVALPFLQRQFHSSTSITALTVIGYTVSLAIFILPFGYLSDRFGKLKISLVGLIIFGIGSILCGAATNVDALIVFRILQGIGAAALQATSAALITTLIDPKHIANALGILGIMIGLGPVLGPSVGGFFLSLNVWRLIFWINVPFALLGLICNELLIKHISEKKHEISFDIIGSLINALMVICLLSGFSLLSNRNNLAVGLGLITIGILVSLLFYRLELRQSAPLIDFHTLNQYPVSWLYLSQTIVFGFASAMIFLLPPFIFEKAMNLNVGLTGLLVLGAPIGLVLFSRISSTQNDGTKNQRFSFIGLLIIAVSLLGLLVINQKWPALVTTLFLFIYGIGGGYFQPANIATIMQVGNQHSQGSIGSLQRMVQNVAIASGTAIGSTVINLFHGQLITSIKVNWAITLGLVIIVSFISLIHRENNN